MLGGTVLGGTVLGGTVGESSKRTCRTEMGRRMVPQLA